MLHILSITPIIFILKIIGDKKFLKTAFVILLGLIISIQFVINYRYADRSDFYIFEDFYKASVNSLPSNSILLSDKWSVFISPGLYYKNVENIRKDVSIISPWGVFTHDWYDRKYNEDVFDRANSTLKKRSDIYISFDVAIHQVRTGKIILPPGSALIPYPYYYRLEYDNKYYPLNQGEFKIRFNDHPVDGFDAYIYTLIPFMLEQRIFYELNFNQTEKAIYYYNLIKKTFNNYTISQKTIKALSSRGINVD